MTAEIGAEEGRDRAPFRSVLFNDPERDAKVEIGEPPFFRDLNLDQIVASVTVGREEYDLRPFCRASLGDVASVAYRQAVFRDVEDDRVRTVIGAFAARMRSMRDNLKQLDKVHYLLEKQRWFLEAVDAYCGAIRALDTGLELTDLRSVGLSGFRTYLRAYVGSVRFAPLADETQAVKGALSSVGYRLDIEGDRVRVNRYDPLPDYSAEVERTFEKFKQGGARDYQFKFSSWPEMNHVEAEVLDRVARLYPDVFALLVGFCERQRDYLDETIGQFDREIQFYLAWLDHVARFTSSGLAFCYPEVSGSSKEVLGRETYDLALAAKLVADHGTVVTNDFNLTDPERILVVSGPNQGGKTTFARTFGQMHFIASLGCPVPGSEARLHLFDRLFTHFERVEDLETQAGKLEMDLRRIYGILQRATPESILVMNESFSSTTLNDAVFLNTQILGAIVERDMLCISVTFLDELASLSAKTVSMVATVDPDDPTVRTFKVIRQAADGLAYSAVLAKKFGLTYDLIRERVGR
jgi:hypothetical protein